MPYRLGYACINATLRKNHKIRANRRAIKKTYEEKGLPHIGDLVAQNLNDLYKILQWNVISRKMLTLKLLFWNQKLIKNSIFMSNNTQI